MTIALNEPIAKAAPDDIELSVVMPCLNEVRTVGRCVSKALAELERLGVRGEVVVADNGSTDGSQAVAREHGARVVDVVERGYGSALQGGIGAACGRFVVMGDADDSYDFGRLAPFVERLRAGDDLVMGNRFRGGIEPGAMPWLHRYVGNPVLTGILNLFFRSPIGDAHCGLRAFRKDAYARLGLRSPGMEFASEMVVKACLQKQKISEAPVVLHPDGRDRPPHLRSFRDGWRHLRLLLLLCPDWLFRLPSIAFMIVGFGLMAVLTPGPLAVGAVVLDVHTMLLGALCLVLGHQTLYLWTFARVHAAATAGADDAAAARLSRQHSLERSLLFGGALLLLGVGCNLWVLREWVARDLGPLDAQATMRFALWGFTGMVTGVQTIFGRFFLSLLLLGRK
ncbi:MAG TPA: glycosyltransferase family 2 protein [Gemmataceae bacterium]|nr:glycosyltransferase family 2 protein [Gemmataceae bacterium]